MHKKDYNNVYQFKITLKNIKPPVWRRIQVPENYSFWDLHVAIQDAMGWFDCHLHEFSAIVSDYNQVKSIGLPDVEMREYDILPGWEENIRDWFFLDKNKAMNYTYDFGDNWEHRLELEKILPKDDNQHYPACIKGKRACPPEDCGGAWGYEDKLKIIKNPEHPEHEDILEWMGDDFNSEAFDCDEVVFDDPSERLKNSGLIEQFSDAKKYSKTEKSKEKIASKIDWEIDYTELSFPLKDVAGDLVNPLLLIIVHPESFFVINTHIASPNSNFLEEFSDKIVRSIKESPLTPGKILVKKKELYDYLLNDLNKFNIEIEIVKSTKTADIVKRDMGKFLRNR